MSDYGEKKHLSKFKIRSKIPNFYIPKHIFYIIYSKLLLKAILDKNSKSWGRGDKENNVMNDGIQTHNIGFHEIVLVID